MRDQIGGMAVKHKKKVLWSIALIILTVALWRATPVHELVFSRRVWFHGVDEGGHFYEGWEAERRWSFAFPAGLVRARVAWYPQTGWLRTRTFLRDVPLRTSGSSREELVIRRTDWSFDGEIRAQAIEYLDEITPAELAVFGNTWIRAPWRWGEKPRRRVSPWLRFGRDR